MSILQRSNQFVLLDGGMGEELEYRGVKPPWYKSLLMAPEVVSKIHTDYILAGADIITTNTYGVTRRNLAKEGLESQINLINKLACEIAGRARDISNRLVLIAGSLPPQMTTYRPDKVAQFEELEPLYREQAEVLAEFVDLFLCETMSSADEAYAAAYAACAAGKPVWVSFTLHEDRSGRLRSGETISDAVAALNDLPVTGFLVNCSAPESITAAIPSLVETGFNYVGGYANTYRPIHKNYSGGSVEFRDDLDPEQYEEHVAVWLNAGATVIGGCCGTRPAHILRLRRLIDSGSY
jgi:S-methylmethionine-dependent homocysteine/selenocysteine methylase